ncbi:MAG: hypothetical protein Q4Q06_02795 [Bacteroidota bacterium]|nr:hypothetical protein [Bacteroidota bacterium]
MTEAEKFWQEFEIAKDTLMDIDSLSEEQADKVMLDMDNKLKKYSKGLDFILGDLTSKGRSFTITANGDKEYFPFVEELMDNAPEFNLWSIEGFLQPEGKHLTMRYNGYILRSGELFFVPLENEEQKDKIGIRVGAKKIVDNEDFEICAYLLVEKMIGEYYATTLIEYFDLVTLPENYKEENFMPLDNLPDYVAWFVQNRKQKA